MYKLIRFYNQNKKKIIRIILVIVFIIILMQVLNELAKNNFFKKSQINSIKYSNEQTNQNLLVSEKSAVSGKEIASNKLKSETDIIKNFFDYCNSGDIESAYGSLTNECKEEMYPTIDDFKKIYFIPTFNYEKKTYTLENWDGNIYVARISGDILSTGKIDDSNTKQDYMTVIKEDDGYKLNINGYVGRKSINKTTKYKNVNMTITQIDTYMDYEIYSLKIENNSDNTIKIDSGDDTKSVYLLDKNNQKCYFFNNEIIDSQFIVQSEFKTNLKIKFSNSYSSSRTMKSIVFSKFILNYDEYNKMENKSGFNDFIEYRVEI